MLINYIAFYTRIWSDKKFKKLSTEGKLLFIYLFANSNVSLTGIYELDKDICPLKLNGEFDNVFNEIINAGMIKWDNDNDLIFVINRFKLIPNKSPKVIQGVINELNIMTHSFKDEFIKIYSQYFGAYMPNLKGYDDKEVNLLNETQIKAFIKLGWQKERIKKFYSDRKYNDNDVLTIINNILP